VSAIRRREFCILLGGSAAAARPLAARAQQPALPVVGFLNSASADAYARFTAALHQGLAEAGFVVGQNVAMEYRWAEGHYERLPALAGELARLRVAVIVANGPAAPAAKGVTATIPIVFTAGFDPVELGLITGLSRPGGNLTGVSILNVELGPKRLELLHEVVPTAAIVALIINPANPNAESQTRELKAAAGALGLKLHVLHASTDRELAAAFETLRELRAGALLIGADPFFNSQSQLLATLAGHHAMPAIYQYREFAAAGGLMSYGGSLTDSYRQAGIYTGRILAGAKPGELPVQQSTKVELIINLKTAKALGIAFPLPLIGRADEVIE
jgi:putative tryptophan/tyrosine transport system substrate-binding protein